MALQHARSDTGAQTWLGGAALMLPENMRAFCRDYPLAATTFRSDLPACSPNTGAAACDCGSDEAIANILARPTFAFESAVWWYTTGSRKVSFL